MSLYKAKSLKGAQTKVRALQKLVAKQNELLNQFDHERRQLALLAAEKPMFFNPLDVFKARKIRDRVISSVRNAY